MLLEIPAVLDPPQLEVVRQALAQATFVDGRLSAGPAAGRVKRNEELDPGEKRSEYLGKIVVGNLYNSATFRNAALPQRISEPFFSRYRPGMAYGAHIDDPVMGSGMRYRCDVAVTVFLNEPESYEGGELVIRTSFGEHRVKLAAGGAVVYPASSLHSVAEVTRGTRLAAVAWIQSLVRDPGRRELLYELNLAREALLATRPDAEETARVDHAYVNLVRMWAEL